MTTEQREAIDKLKNLLAKGKYGIAGKTLLYEDYYMLKNVLEVVENQEQKIIKQQEKIETLKSINKNQDKDIKKAVDYTFELNKEIEHKEKIIDLMSEQLAGLTIWNTEKDEPLILTDKEEVINYFANKVNSKIQ